MGRRLFNRNLPVKKNRESGVLSPCLCSRTNLRFPNLRELLLDNLLCCGALLLGWFLQLGRIIGNASGGFRSAAAPATVTGKVSEIHWPDLAGKVGIPPELALKSASRETCQWKINSGRGVSVTDPAIMLYPPCPCPEPKGRDLF